MTDRAMKRSGSRRKWGLYCLTSLLGLAGCSTITESDLSTATPRSGQHAVGTSALAAVAGESVLHDARLYNNMIQNGQFSEAAIWGGLHDALLSDARTVNWAEFLRTDAGGSTFEEPHIRQGPDDRVVTSLGADWHASLGWSLVLDGNSAGAEAAYRQALRHNRELAEAYLGLGIALMMQDKPTEAVSAFEEALTLRPDYPAALVHLGYAYKDGLKGEQDYQRAGDLFQEASKLGDPFALLALVDLDTHRNNGA